MDVTTLMNEGPIRLNDVPKLLPPGRNGKRYHAKTIWRWAMRGVETDDGKIVKLESCRIGGGDRFTTWPAVERFNAARNIADAPTPAPATPKQRKKREDAAVAHLAAKHKLVC